MSTEIIDPRRERLSRDLPQPADRSLLERLVKREEIVVRKSIRLSAAGPVEEIEPDAREFLRPDPARNAFAARLVAEELGRAHRLGENVRSLGVDDHPGPEGDV